MTDEAPSRREEDLERYAVTTDRILTVPYLLSFMRLALVPVFLWLLLGPRETWSDLLALVILAVSAVTDWLDGYLARRQGTTSAGAFLDPLADKVLILGAMFTLVSTGVFAVVPVVIIAARELIISVYRVLVGGKGISVPAIKLAKYKTVCQQGAVAFALLPLTAVDATWLWMGFLWLAVALALVSGAQYLLRARRLEAAAPEAAVDSVGRAANAE